METPKQTILVRHNQFGEDYTFSVTSNVPGILSKEANVAELSEPGLNAQGTINNEVTVGEGQFITALDGTSAAGVTIEYNREIGIKEIPIFRIGPVVGTHGGPGTVGVAFVLDA